MKSTIVLLATLALSWPAQAADRYTVDGLEKPAEIIVDRWGVPHIYAGTHYDTFFVQGFNAARDRLWQIDLWRRRGLGALSEVFGPAFVEQDEAARLFLYRGSLFREWLAYGSDAKQIAEAFVAGINAYVSLARENEQLMPPEFGILGYEPATWKPEDIVRIRSNGLWRNVLGEALRAMVVCKFNLEVDALRKKLEPSWTTSVPEGLEPCDITPDVVRLYALAKAPVDFTLARQFAKVSKVKGINIQSVIAHFESDFSNGSNNWAVAPGRTATGRPILADDPHRGHAVPSLRYIAHLSGPGIDVIGAGEPALPGISIGHNERIAFGLTIFSIDQEDLMVYRVKNGEYAYQGTWRPMRRVIEEIPVFGEEPRRVELRFTIHGPVIYEQDGRAFAVQAAWLEPGMAPYFGSVEYMRAGNWREFLAALNRWGAPSENQVYADVDGNIGYKPAGLAPIRTNYDGLLPVPGDGSYEWRGFYDMDQLPVEANPERGWVATANAMSLPPDYPYRQRKLGFEWANPWRIDRISEVLAATPKHTIQDSVALQRDYLSIPARRILGALPIEDLPAPADSLFAGWDFRLTRDAAAAALFEVWWSRHLKGAVMRQVLEIEDLADLGQPDGLVVVESFEAMAAEQRLLIARQSLQEALSTGRALLGEDVADWRWADIHRMKFRHPLYDLVDGDTRKLLEIPVVSRGGSGDTPNSTRYGRDFAVVSGASWRMVLDVGNWDNAYMTNAPGQSGDPRSLHYDDLLESWAGDGSLPLVYSREAVERNASRRIELLPSAKNGQPTR